ncbi:MAG: hypothetical protein A2X12_10880 [Bacteroidetes bacterium GWE2_29_8]|nr:MAG: hypothetical protein A2X12_10880 [Bacteroidetes bacterium GWE2_29_8]OFY23958.1 MAG: hypothetical protein A2X02_00915 [Bacteroidetes bacterium GWF2_29_10]
MVFPKLTKLNNIKFVLKVLIILLSNVATLNAQTLLLKDIEIFYGELTPKFRGDVNSYNLITADMPNINNYIRITTNSPNHKIIVNGLKYNSNELIYFKSINNIIKIELFDENENFNQYYIFVNNIKPELFKNDSNYKVTVSSIKLFRGGIVPNFFDNGGSIYGHNKDSIFVSRNFGSYWEFICVIPDSFGTISNDAAFFITKDNKIVTVTDNGSIIVSDKTQKKFQKKASFFTNSKPINSLGSSMYDSIILLASYRNPNNFLEAFYSDDNGETWNKILEEARIKDDPSNCHVHDIKYDKYRRAITYVSGDGPNCSLGYSYDMGKTWNYSYQKEYMSKNRQQFAQIIPFKHGLILGSDFRPDGLYYLPQINDTTGDVFRKELISPLLTIDNADKLIRFSVKTNEINVGDKTMVLLPWTHKSQVSPYIIDSTRLWGTFNGIEWWELFVWNADWNKGNLAFGFDNILGPYINDKKNTVYASFSNRYLFRAELNIPIPNMPILDTDIKDVNPIIKWERDKYAIKYKIEISNDYDFDDKIYEDTAFLGNYLFFKGFKQNHKYWIRIKASGLKYDSDWSKPLHITFEKNPIYKPYFYEGIDPICNVEKPIADIELKYCLNDVAKSLTAIGNNIKWYASLNDSVPLKGTDIAITNKSGNYFYYVTQMDSIGVCESEKLEVQIKVFDLPKLDTIVVRHNICHENNDAEINIVTSNNFLKYYLNNTKIEGSNISNLGIGDYALTIIDTNNCYVEKKVTINSAFKISNVENVKITKITEKSIIIKWDKKYNNTTLLRYKIKDNNNNWSYLLFYNKEDSTRINYLNPSTSYEIQIQNIVDKDIYSCLTTYYFKTLSEENNNCAIVNTINYNKEKNTLFWNKNPNASLYMLRIKEKNRNNWKYYNIEKDTSIYLNNIIQGQVYEVQIRTYCDLFYKDFSNIYEFKSIDKCPVNNGLETIDIGTTEAVLKWEGMGYNNKYLVRWKSIEENTWNYIWENGYEDRVQIGCVHCNEIDKLKKNTVYEWQISNFCNIELTHFSSFSNTQTFKTKDEDNKSLNASKSKSFENNLNDIINVYSFGKNLKLETYFNNNKQVKITVFDNLGKEFTSKTLNIDKSYYCCDLFAISKAGVYIVKVEYENILKNFKVLIL